jgi:hypothetical protein
MSHLYFEDLKNKLNDTEVTNNLGYISPNAITMIHIPNLNNIQDLLMYIMENNIEGDLIETGVWRGGAVILMAAINKFYNLNKKVYACDSYEGLPKNSPHTEDNIVNGNDKRFDYAVSLEEVKNNFIKYDLLDDNIIFVKGFFEDTMKDIKIDKISMLRLDGDMYISTIVVLEALYDKVTQNGVIIIDDYHWDIAGCGNAVDDFREKRNITSKINFSYGCCIWWIKE